MYGRAKFDLLRLRVLAPVKKHHERQNMEMEGVYKQQRKRAKELRASADTSIPQYTTFRVIEVA